MTEFSNKPSYDEIFNELTILQMTNSSLNNEIRRLRKNIQKIQDIQGLEICEYFSTCKSIRETCDKFCFQDIEECYESLKEYFGCSDPLQKANDFEECYKEIFGSNKDEEELRGERIAENKNTENLIIEDLEVN
jgi:hypothetical protein